MTIRPFIDLLSELLPCDNLSAKITEIVDTDLPSPILEDDQYRVVTERIARALFRSTPKHLILTREHGIGESAFLLELLQLANQGQYRFIQDNEFIRINAKNIHPANITPTLNSIAQLCTEFPDTTLIIDNISWIFRQSNAALNHDLIQYMLNNAASRLVFMMTPYEYDEYFAIDAHTQDVFSMIELPEPGEALAKHMVRQFAAGLAHEYEIQFSLEAIDQAVDLSNTFILNQRLPTKAVRILRELCEDAHFDRKMKIDETLAITDEHVFKKISEITSIPVQTLKGIGDGKDYNVALKENILGQNHAVSAAANELSLIKAGLNPPGKPASVMLFVGQTGTGKTEMAKAIAKLYSSSKKLKTFTLGNFSEPHSVSGLIGVPAGYVGHDQGGRLINELNADPYGVVLLDEADKAHPDVMQPLLNLFDEGWVYDQRGVKAYADRAIFILTTNVGQRQIADMCAKGKSIEEITSSVKDMLTKIRHNKSNRPVFTPEFIARIKKTVVFLSLDRNAMINITHKIAKDVDQDWQNRRNKHLSIDTSLLDTIGDLAFRLNEKSKGREGGRLIRKIFAELVESSVQAQIANQIDDYNACSTVHVKANFPEEIPAEETAAYKAKEHIQVGFIK